MKFKIGDKVMYKDGDKHIYTVLGIYSKDKVSLSLRDYDDTEQDFLTNIKDIKKAR